MEGRKERKGRGRGRKGEGKGRGRGGEGKGRGGFSGSSRINNLPANAGDTGSISSLEKIPNAMAQLSWCTTAIEPVPWSRETAATEPTHPGACALQQGELQQLKPAQCNKEQPRFSRS